MRRGRMGKKRMGKQANTLFIFKYRTVTAEKGAVFEFKRSVTRTQQFSFVKIGRDSKRWPVQPLTANK